MLSALLLHFPVVAGLVVGALTGLAIQHHSTFLQFVLSSVASLFVMIASLMYLSVMPDGFLECEGWDCIEKGSLFDVMGLMGASLTFAAIVITISLLRLIAYKSRNDRHYWTD